MSEASHNSGIQRAAILGAGTMGHGIAHVCAMAGIQTRLFDIQQEAVERGRQQIEANLQKGIDRNKVTPEAKDKTLAHLQTHTDLQSAVRDCDLVIEAVPERLELKQKLFAQVAEHCGAETIFGTNTSSLSVAKIAAAVTHPERVIGLHFFNPVHIMKLLEIIVPEGCSEQTQKRARAFGEGIGKSCILVKDAPGFATSRLGLVIGLEAIRMVEQGVASAEDIDKAMTLGYGFPMGPLRLTDLVGLDVRLHIAEYLSEHLEPGEHFKPPALLREMVAAGKLGKKSGQGFYSW